MLLQRSHAAIWGKADPGETVTVTLGSKSAKTTADNNGKWRVNLDGLEPGIAGEMRIQGKNAITVQNVAVGDVWLCSGQSNMQMAIGSDAGLKGVLNSEQEIAAAQYPLIWMFSIPRTASDTPLEEVDGKWEVCTPETVSPWSATAYFFGRQLHKDLNLPIGLIHASKGGTYAQAWTPNDECLRGQELIIDMIS
jgi:sialate O-acetylesterase